MHFIVFISTDRPKIQLFITRCRFSIYGWEVDSYCHLHQGHHHYPHLSASGAVLWNVCSVAYLVYLISCHKSVITTDRRLKTEFWTLGLIMELILKMNYSDKKQQNGLLFEWSISMKYQWNFGRDGFPQRTPRASRSHQVLPLAGAHYGR